MSADLNPCPFCGGEAVGFFDSECISVECVDCNCHTGSRDTEAEAIEVWNRRAPVASAPALKYLEQLAVEETLACVQEHSGTPLANKLSAIIARITGEGDA